MINIGSCGFTDKEDRVRFWLKMADPGARIAFGLVWPAEEHTKGLARLFWYSTKKLRVQRQHDILLNLVHNK